MNEKSEIFIETFNQLEAALKKKLKKEYYTPYSVMVQEAAIKDVFIEKYKTLLESFGDLRNVLVHKEGGEIIAIPSDEAVAMLIKLVERYTMPKKLYDICNHRVTIMGGDRSMAEALKVMKKYNFTKIPIFQKNEYIGLLSGNVVTSWFAEHTNEDGEVIVKLKDVTIEDVLDEVGKKAQVVFVDRNMDVHTFIKQSQKQPSKSGVYLVTENGRSSEKLVGIITNFDYPKLLRELEI